MRLALLSLLLLALIGCVDTTARDQAVANSAATIYEAAVAIERGVPAATTLPAIKANALAIVIAEGYTWPPPASPVPGK